MSALDRFTKGWKPAKPHLVRGSGGLSGEINDLRGDVEGALEKVAAETGTVASEISSAVSGLQSVIAQVSDDANASLDSAVSALSSSIGLDISITRAEAQALVSALSASADAGIAQASDGAGEALYSAVGVLSARITQDVASAISEAQALASALSAATEAEIVQASSDANATLVSAVGVLSARIAQDVAFSISEAQALAASLSAVTDAEIAQASDDAAAALDSAVGVLNVRIGKISAVTTNDAAATVLSAVTPTPFDAVKVFKKVVAHRLDRLESAAYTVEALARALPSVGILTVGGTPLDGDLVTIDGQAYVWQAVITPGTPFEVASGGSAAQAIINLVKAINLTGIADTDYGAGTTKHPTVSAAVASASTMEAVARTPGVAGDTITTTDTEAGTLLSWSGATLASGSDMTVSSPVVAVIHEDDAAWVVAIAVDGPGTGYEVKVTGVADTSIEWREEDSSLKV